MPRTTATPIRMDVHLDLFGVAADERLLDFERITIFLHYFRQQLSSDGCNRRESHIGALCKRFSIIKQRSD
jgi:hypothetical protein